MIDSHAAHVTTIEKPRGVRRGGRLPSHVEAEIAGNNGEIAVSKSAQLELEQCERALRREVRVCRQLEHSLCNEMCHIVAARQQMASLETRRRIENAALCNGETLA